MTKLLSRRISNLSSCTETHSILASESSVVESKSVKFEAPPVALLLTPSPSVGIIEEIAGSIARLTESTAMMNA